MSADVVNLQVQVEAVLGSLVKAATVELIKLFEGRFRATVRSPDATQCADGKETFEVTNSSSTEGTKRSVGVQVDPQDTYGVLPLPVFPRVVVQGQIRAGWIFFESDTLLHCHVCLRARAFSTTLVRLHSFQRRLEECVTIETLPPTPRRCPGPPVRRGWFEGSQGAAAGGGSAPQPSRFGSEATGRCGFMRRRSKSGRFHCRGPLSRFSSSCQIVVQTADVVKSRLCEADCPADGKAGTESVLDGKDDARTWSQNIVSTFNISWRRRLYGGSPLGAL